MPRSLRNGLTTAWCAGAVFAVVLAPGKAAEPAKDQAIVPQAANLGRPVDFEKDVYPILETNCLACHNVAIAESKLNVESVETIRKGGKRGPALVPQKPDASLLFQFASRGKQPAMPPLPNKVDANALTPRQLGIIKQWIQEGARGGAGAGGDAIQWQPIPAGVKSIFSVALSPDGGRFVAAGRANQIVIYDVPTKREVDRLIDPLLSEIKLDGQLMYLGGAADRDFIHALAFSPDGSLLAAGGYRVVKFWKRPQNVQKHAAALADAPTALAVSPDGALVAVALADHSIVLERPDGTATRKLSGAAASITALTFAPDGKRLYGTCLDHTLRAWKLPDGSPERVVTAGAELTALAVSKDGKQVISGRADGKIEIWAVAKMLSQPATKPAASVKPLREWKAHDKSVTSLAFVSPKGGTLISGSEDGTVRMWQIESGKQLAKLEHGGTVTAVAAASDGEVLASAGVNGMTRLWKRSGGSPIAEIKGRIYADRLVAQLTDAKIIAAQHVATATARVTAATQDVKEHEETLKKVTDAQTAAEKAVADLAEKEKTATEAVVAAKKSSHDKPKDAKLKTKLTDGEKALSALGPAQKNAASAAASAHRAHERAKKALDAIEEKLSDQKKLKNALEQALSDAAKSLAEATVAADKSRIPVRSIAFSTDGSLLAVAGDDRDIQLYDAHTGRPLETLSGHRTGIARVAFGKGSTLISAGLDKKLVDWETNPRWQFVGRIGPKPEAPLDLSGSSLAGRVLCLAFNHDGTLLATGSGEPSRSGELKTWKFPSLAFDREFKDAHSDTVFGVDFSRDGKYLASCAADKFVKVFETHTGKQVRSFEGHTHQVLAVSWKADGSLLASAGADNLIKVWNFDTGEQQRSISSHSKQSTSIQFIGTGSNLVTASGDKTVRLHQAIDGDNYRTLEGATDYLYSAAATADESLIAAGGEDGVLRLWNGATGKMLVAFGPNSNKDSTQASAAKR
jgi:WD40 repeat protein